jgi:Spy/CpxP family protein refolding chaperone
MPGMGGGPGGPAATFGLSEEQAGEMRRLSEELRKEHWDLMGRMMDKRAELQELYAEDRPDPEAVGEAYEEMAKLRREMIEGRIELQNRMFDLLSEEQRERMKQSRERAAPAPGAAEGSGYGQPGRGYGPGPAMPGPAMAPGAGPGHGMGPEGPGQAMMGRPSDMSGQPAAGPGEVPEGEGQPPAEVEVE